MRGDYSAALLLGFLIVGCGVVAGHQDHLHREKQIPLHEQEYVQDTAEELERKWSFEVSCLALIFTIFCHSKDTERNFRVENEFRFFCHRVCIVDSFTILHL
jgi:hypothetical protein